MVPRMVQLKHVLAFVEAVKAPLFLTVSLVVLIISYTKQHVEPHAHRDFLEIPLLVHV